MITIVAVVSLLIGLAVGVVAGRGRRSGDRSATVVEAEPFAASVAGLGREVLPVWSAQVESSRHQMETAVSAIVERFVGIVGLLDAALLSSRSTADLGQTELFVASEGRLGEIVASLRDALERKRRTVGELRDLLNLNNELRSMIIEVRKVSAQTHLLALNASIEAARVGPAGRAFSVIAMEISQLADLSGTTTERIGTKVAKVAGAIETVCALAEDEAEREERTVTDANAKVTLVLAELRQLVDQVYETTGELGTAAKGVRQQVEDSIVHFQFQDRLAQTLEHLRESVDLVGGLLAAQTPGDTRPLDVAEVLTTLRESYTMAQEQQTHQSRSPVTVTGSDITFF